MITARYIDITRTLTHSVFTYKLQIAQSQRITRQKRGECRQTGRILSDNEEEAEAILRAKDSAPLIRLSGIQNRGKGYVKTFGQLVKYVDLDEMNIEIGRYFGRKGLEYDENRLNHAACVLFHQIDVPVQQFQTGQWITQVLRCTVNKTFYGAQPRRDWVWYRVQQVRPNQRQKPLYGALRGRLPVRLRCLFKLLPPGERKPLYLAFVEMTTPVDSGHAEDCTGLVRVLKPSKKAGETTRTTGYRIIDVVTIEGAAHLIPDFDDATESHEKGYVVNSHIDLNNWNMVYDWTDEAGEAIEKAVVPASKAAKAAALRPKTDMASFLKPRRKT